MNRRPSHEPSREFGSSRRLWDDATRHTSSLGCPTCLDLGRCGGLHTEAGLLDCADLCSCPDKASCDMVCRFKPGQFVRRMREVGGFSFETAARAPVTPIPYLPTVVPFVADGYSRVLTLDEPFVAFSLYDIINLGTGELHVAKRQALGQRFRIPPSATVILSGVDKDPKIERWWELPNRPELLAGLRRLGIALVTAPNYSVLSNVPRTDNLHSMKRILLAWVEMAQAGLAAALHLNARTDADYRRWSRLIRDRDEIQVIAFEFATGCGQGDRIDWHVQQLCQVADTAGRPLSLVMRGGARKLPEIRQHFAQVTLVETEAFARTMRRRRAILTEGGRLRWVASPTPEGKPIDELLAHNIGLVRVSHEAGSSRTAHPRLPTQSPRHPAQDRYGQSRQASLLRDLHLPRETGTVAQDLQGVIVAAKT